VRIRSRRRPAETPEQQADESTAELAASYWQAYDQRMATIGFLAMARQFPGLVAQALRLGLAASRRDIVAAITLNVASTPWRRGCT
jgi:hypothetical protein